MLVRSKDSTLLRTLLIASAGLALPLLWPGLLVNLFSVLPGAGHAAPTPVDLSVLLVVSDVLIFMSYTFIAAVLTVVVYRNRRVLPFDWVVLAFGLFIVACGFTHIMHVLVRVSPLVWLDGYVRAVTAIVSVATAVALPPLVPRVGALLSAERQAARHAQELERANALLREAIERIERQRDELAAANEQLSRSNAELEQFAYVASHDLQAPIRAVTSFADLVSLRYGHAVDERGQAYLRQIVDNGLHMKRLVDDLLTFSRVTAAAHETDVVSLNELLDAVAARLQPELDAVGGELSRGELPRVRGDASQLDQLLQNLVSNALKYHRDGVPPRVWVTAVAEPDALGRAWWRFSVEDNGIGIEEKYFEKIFVIFQRLHGRDAFDGTGIGLAVCKRIVERHGGRLWLESTPGVGSTFLFSLPASPPEDRSG